MKLKNMGISRQINLWLGTVFLIIVLLAASSLVYMEINWDNTEKLYNYPLTVRRALGKMEVGVVSIHRDMRQLPMENDQREIENLIRAIDMYEADINQQMAILYDRYLGPRSDLDELSDALIQWKTIRGETVRLLRAGQVEEVVNRVKASGVGGAQAEQVKISIAKISDFSMVKSDEFYQAAQGHRQQNIVLMITLLIGILTALFGIGYSLRKSILPPLNKLAIATEAMRKGQFDIRVQHESTNEMGALSNAFNAMAETIKTEMAHKDHVANVSSALFAQDSLRPFCQELLKNLLLFTDSQIGAIYFLSEGKNRFEKYESIGAKLDQLSSFSVSGKDGEFGAAIATRKIQHVREIPSDLQVVFSAVSGDFKAREIITIPVVNGSDVVSVISIASIKSFTPASVRLIHSLSNEITARLDALLASQRILEFSQKLQNSNTKLEQQAKELEMQTNELSQQTVELELKKKQLEEASRLKTSFLSNMSHELRTPLNSVIALTGVLNRRLADKIPEEEYSYLEIIERNGKNLLSLINDILDISRIEAGREEIETTKFNVNHAIAEVAIAIEPMAKGKSIELLHESRDSELFINSDADKVRHILQNLIANAVKFTEQGKVTVSARKDENNIEIKVSDTGIGISQEHLPYVFDEFRQADGSTSRRFGGTGLGLAISKKYANLLGGTISVKSVPEEGSEFTLSLPLRHASENRSVEEESSDKLKDTIEQPLPRSFYNATEKSILLVEDNESAIIQISDLMEEMGYHIAVAHDGGEALEMIEQSIPDAMILDLMMPVIDGFEVLEILRNEERTAHIPVLILSAKHITKEELKFLKRNNVHQLIQKGDVDRTGLQKAVSSMLFPKTEKAKEPQRNPQPIEGKPVVLVVEDNPDNMITVKALLTDQYTVLEAIDAHRGIELAKEHVPNVVLMDIALPDINGVEAFKAIREMPQLQHIPVIALTASAMTHDRETILSHGFDAFIAKPIIEKEFFQVISEVLYGK
jgi:signal transduction histidine kinase/CheY-like chemotaxis protein